MKIAHCARITRWLHTTPAPARSSLRPGHPPQRPVSGHAGHRSRTRRRQSRLAARGRVRGSLRCRSSRRRRYLVPLPLSHVRKIAVVPMRTGITTLCTARAGRLGGRDGCNRINQRASRVLTLDPTRAESPEQMPLDSSKPMTGLIMIGYGRSVSLERGSVSRGKAGGELGQHDQAGSGRDTARDTVANALHIVVDVADTDIELDCRDVESAHYLLPWIDGVGSAVPHPGSDERVRWRPSTATVNPRFRCCAGRRGNLDLATPTRRGGDWRPVLDMAVRQVLVPPQV
ncbi:hypothetical protein M2275_001872 [Rhodococcus opacus]|jgi:hypothetical protein|nr:hypothetical protein [Rhodococcus opacus]